MDIYQECAEAITKSLGTEVVRYTHDTHTVLGILHCFFPDPVAVSNNNVPEDVITLLNEWDRDEDKS